MKRTILTVICLMVTLTVILGALLYEPKTEYNADAKRFVCIINPGNYYWADVKEGLLQADKDLGSYTKYCSFERFDIETQIRLLRETAYRKVDGIITLGEPYSNELNEEIRSLEESGVPVVLVDTDAEQSGRSCYIGSNNYKAGQMAAEELIEATGGCAHIAVFVSRMDSANQRERLSGFLNVVAPYKDMEILETCEDQGDKIAIQEDLKRLLNEYENLDAIFCAEASSAQQVGFVLENEQSPRDVKIVGFDDAKAVLNFVKEGIYTATIVQKGFDMGYQAVQYLNDYEEGKTTEPQKIFADVFCITEDNVSTYLESSQGYRPK